MAHQAHEEERGLEDMLFDKGEAVHEGVVPGDAVEVEEEGEEPEEDFDADDLGRSQCQGGA